MIDEGSDNKSICVQQNTQLLTYPTHLLIRLAAKYFSVNMDSYRFQGPESRRTASLHSLSISTHACSSTSPADILDSAVLSAPSYLIHITFSLGCAARTCEPWRFLDLYLRAVTMSDCGAASLCFKKGQALLWSEAVVSLPPYLL